ncbi:MAG: hypothetical protein ACRCSP_00685 [Rhodoglobus sp.]
MRGDRLAHLSLRFDAIYCLALGLIVAVTSPFTVTAGGVALSPAILLGAGGATMLWGVYVWHAESHWPIRSSTCLVMVANIVASTGLALTGIVAGATVFAFAASALAIDIAAFAVSQGIALRRLTASMTI